jgi:transcriptional regulator with GAF, ATPase, and Fis domain
MQEVPDGIVRVARIARPVLVIGERGTGKDLVARAIHQTSGRAAGVFLAVNCAALAETLLESELFDHERGVFTGADRRVAGKFELAGSGTLFLDEIAHMPLALALPRSVPARGAGAGSQAPGPERPGRPRTLLLPR